MPTNRKRSAGRLQRTVVVFTVAILPWLLAFGIFITALELLNGLEASVEATARGRAQAVQTLKNELAQQLANHDQRIHEALLEHERRQEARARQILAQQKRQDASEGQGMGSPNPKPKPKPSKSPKPSPSPTPTCILVPLICF